MIFLVFEKSELWKWVANESQIVNWYSPHHPILFLLYIYRLGCPVEQLGSEFMPNILRYRSSTYGHCSISHFIQSASLEVDGSRLYWPSPWHYLPCVLPTKLTPNLIFSSADLLWSIISTFFSLEIKTLFFAELSHLISRLALWNLINFL